MRKLYSIYLGLCFILFGILILYPAETGIAAETTSQQQLNSAYFLPPTDKTFIYSGCDNHTYNYYYTSQGQRDQKGVYTEKLSYKDQSTSYTRYTEADNAVVELESGFAIPQSEYSSETIISGAKVVCRAVTPGATWDNQYQVKDNYGSIYAYTSRYRYWGLETLQVMGKPMKAAKITWYQQCKAVNVSPEAEWSTDPHTATGTLWYVEGYGLVKSESKSWQSSNDVYQSTLTLAKVQ